MLYFAGLREAVGTARERVELPEGVATAAALRAFLRARGAPWADALAETRTLRAPAHQRRAAAAAPRRAGAEVRFFPPVTGG